MLDKREGGSEDKVDEVKRKQAGDGGKEGKREELNGWKNGPSELEGRNEVTADLSAQGLRVEAALQE